MNAMLFGMNWVAGRKTMYFHSARPGRALAAAVIGVRSRRRVAACAAALRRPLETRFHKAVS